MAMMKHDPRKTLLQQIADLRKSIDPKVLDRAHLATQGKEPYDKEAARAAVRNFLDAKSAADGGAFKRRLLEALKQYDAAPPPSDPPRRIPRR